MRRAAIIFLLSLSVIINSDVRELYGFKKISDTFSKYGIECLRYNVSGSIETRDGCRNKEDFQNIVSEALHYMNIPENDTSIVYNEQSRKGFVEGQYNGGKFNIDIASPGDGGGYTMTFDITQYEDIGNIYDMGETVKSLLERFGSLPHVNFCIVGCKPGEISDWGRDEIMHGFMEALGGRTIDSINSEGLMSICGYSDILAKPLKYGSLEMNVNIGSRYDSFDNMTCFLIGTPIINEEY